MKLQVLEYLSDYGIKYLQQELFIKVREHKYHPHLLCLNYSQVDSPLSNPIVKECRSLILDSHNCYKPISFPFSRFPNWGESGSESLDWSSAKVYDKVDGSLIHLYWYKDKWWTSTRSVPDGETLIGNSGISFLKLVNKIWEAADMRMPSSEHKSYCFSFELVSKYNRVVVPYATKHPEGALYLLAVRDMNTLVEYEPLAFAKQYNWVYVNSYDLTSIDSILKATKELDPMQGEGFVVRDAQWNRVKVKSPRYVALSLMKDEFTERRMLQLVLANEISEFLSYFPEYKPLYDSTYIKVKAILDELEAVYSKYRNIENQKEFALAIQPNYRLRGALFTKRKFEQQGKDIPFREILQNCSITNIEQLLKD